jgi:hypothetical protein
MKQEASPDRAGSESQSIERKYDLNVVEIDNIRKRFHNVMLLMRDYQGIEFLSPEPRDIKAD